MYIGDSGDILTTEYTIQQLTREFDVTARALRHYEDQGILKPRREGNKRIYSRRDRVRLLLTIRGRRFGFTLAECRELYDIYDSTRDDHQQLSLYRQRLSEKRAGLEQQARDLQAVIDEIKQAENKITRQMAQKQ